MRCWMAQILRSRPSSGASVTCVRVAYRDYRREAARRFTSSLRVLSFRCWVASWWSCLAALAHRAGTFKTECQLGCVPCPYLFFGSLLFVLRAMFISGSTCRAFSSCRVVTCWLSLVGSFGFGRSEEQIPSEESILILRKGYVADAKVMYEIFPLSRWAAINPAPFFDGQRVKILGPWFLDSGRVRDKVQCKG